MQNRIKILIIGTGSLRNYGCEAIVRGTYNIIKNNITNYEIFLASDDVSYDRQILPNEIYPIKYRKRFTFYRLFKGILRRFFHIGNGSAVRMNTSIARNFDIVLSCGGDNFCEAPDGSLYSILIDLMRVGTNAHKNNKKYILWGASVGPFKNNDNHFKVFENLKIADMICVRENISYEYIGQDITLKDKLKLVADPAFCMDPDFNINFPKEKNAIYIGLNISTLSIYHTIHKEKVYEFINNLFNLLDKILGGEPDYRFVLIPHVVIGDSGPQNDRTFLKQYLQFTKYKDKVILLPDNLGAAKTKGYISKMDMLIAARMHCCVGGISTSTPTLFVTYSNKGKGMSFYAYGNHDNEITVPEMTTEKFPAAIKYMIDNRLTIHKYLEAQHNRFITDAMKGGEYLKELINKSHGNSPNRIR